MSTMKVVRKKKVVKHNEAHPRRHIALLSPIVTSDRKRKDLLGKYKTHDVENPTENDVLMGRGGKNNQVGRACCVFNDIFDKI